MFRLVTVAMLVTGATQATELPSDPFQRTAVKALRGDFGKLKPWQVSGYKAGLTAGVTVQGLAWVTSYYPQEGFYRGKGTRSRVGVSERSAAVSRATWAQRRGMYVWTAAYGIRIIEDSGATSNDRVARRKGADTWVDKWFPRPMNRNPVTLYAMWRGH